MGREIAVLGGGCFWCLEAVFLELKGVERVVSGYAGGAVENPSYREVCSGTTGHAEVVQISFHPEEISFREILEVFFTIHDPTTLNRQGADRGTQYRSTIFFSNDSQKSLAEEVIQELDGAALWENPIVTEVAPLERFYPAEGEHQDYYQQHGDEPYCRLVIDPKVAKFRNKFINRLKE